MSHCGFPAPSRSIKAAAARNAQRLLAAFLFFAPAANAQRPRVTFGESIRDVARIPECKVTRADLSATEQKEKIDFAISLKMRNFPDLQARLGRRERIPRDEMARAYHPADSDYQAVVDWLKAEGFTIGPDDPSHLSVFASGTVAQIARSFQTKFSRVSFRSWERSSAITAPTLPDTIAPAVLGVNGLQPQFFPQKHSRQQRAVPDGSVGKNSTTGNGPPFLPSQIMTAYGASGLTQTGAGQTIGIVIDTPPSSTDLTKFWTTCGVSQSLSNIQTIQVVSGNLPSPSGEESLDVEWSSSIAPAAQVRVYATLDLSFTHIDQAYARIYSDLASQPSLHQVSLSYGLGEIYNSPSQMNTDEQYFANLLSAGVTVFVSSGDGGSNPTSSGGSGGGTPNVETPANSPSVMGVGGTSLYVNSTTGIESSETVWSGTGGGVSTYFSRPSWQTGNGVPSGTKRFVPDVAAPADPNTGGLVVLNGTNYQYGGTSWGAPTWAGIAALINQARSDNGMSSLGSLGPRIYPLIGGSAFRDITSGSNGAYSAGAGYDECTGIGVPNPAALLQTLVGGPVIGAQPANQIVSSGDNATFTVAATGSGTLAYQWQREPYGGSSFTNLSNDSTYSGATTASLAIANASAAMSGDSFQCVVTNAYGSAKSTSAQLIVSAPAVPLDVATFAGSVGITGGNDGTGFGASFNYPGGIAVDGSGNLFVADTSNHTIRKITPQGVVTTIAGTAGTSGSSNSGLGKFSSPGNVAVDSSGNIYVADTGNSTIRKISSNGTVSTLAGSAGFTGSTNSSTGSRARFNHPQGVAVTGSGTVYVADTGNHMIRKVTSSGSTSTLAGSAGHSGSTDATGTSARFNSPSDVALDASGNVYVADTGNHAIRKITSAGATTTLAGSPGLSGWVDGFGGSARFNSPKGVRTDAAGDVIVADTNNHTIRWITPLGVVSTVAGLAGNSGSADGVGSAALFNDPYGAVADGGGTVYVVDTYNQTIRIATPSAAPQFEVQPLGVTTDAGQTAVFSVTATGNPAPGFQWQRLPSGTANWLVLSETPPYSGTASPSLTITGVTKTMSGDQFRCVISNSVDISTSTPAVLTVNLVNSAPAADSQTLSVNEDTSLPVTLTATDVDGDSLTYHVTVQPAHGALSGTPPNMSYLPAANYNGPDSLAFTANDGTVDSAPAVVSITVIPVNDPPVAQAQSLSVTQGATLPITLTATDVDGNSLTYNVTVQPAHGTLTGTPPDLTYTPTADYGGPDSLTFTANDGTVDSAPAVVSITVVDPPAITSASAATFITGKPGAFTVTATGDPAPTFSATGLPAWATLDSGTGVLSGTPPDTAGAPFAIGLTATNGTGADATQSFTLNVETPFTAWTDEKFGANADNPAIAGPDADPDHDGIPNLLEYVLGGNPLVSSAAILPTASLDIDPNDGNPHLTLTANLDAGASDVAISAEVSSDLETWDPGAVEAAADTTSNGVRTIVFRDKTAADAAATRYIRLRATQP